MNSGLVKDRIRSRRILFPYVQVTMHFLVEGILFLGSKPEVTKMAEKWFPIHIKIYTYMYYSQYGGEKAAVSKTISSPEEACPGLQ